MSDQSWRLEIEHLTHFEYGEPARCSYNEIRMLPLTTLRQTTMSAQAVTIPSATQYRYWDYWGSQVIAFDVTDEHETLDIRATSLIDLTPAPPRPDAGWEELSACPVAVAEFLDMTPYTAMDARRARTAAELRQPTPAATVKTVVEWVHGALDYEPGVTGVHTSALEALDAGKGVCQDFAHLAVALLRQLGVPARYVSGYLHPVPEPAIAVDVVGESHAWIEAWTGDWWEADPTNLVPVGARHVMVGRGRDYADVPPVKGIYAGGGGEDKMTTVVRIKRVPRQ